MGVYGSFIDNFFELMETIKFIKGYQIRAVYVPSQGTGGVRKKFTSGNWAVDFDDSDLLCVPVAYKGKINIGDIFQYSGDNKVITRIADFTLSGDFLVCKVERQQGATIDQNQDLEINQGGFR